ncbi:MAG: YhcG family protein [Gammaproteobacteria bacterium]
MEQKIGSAEYHTLLNRLKKHILESRSKAALSVNKELILLYYHIGLQILQSQANQGWGKKVIEELSRDLSVEFPEMKGFGVRNLGYMKRFSLEYQEDTILQAVLAKLPWYHHVTLLDKIKDKKTRIFYMQKAVEYGWSRNAMVMQIELELHKRQGQSVTNFHITLPLPQSELAQNTLKDPYIFDFLSIGEKAHEREMEKALIQHMEKFLLELGAGFAFVGRQYHLEVSDKDFYIDLLFYHLTLRCFVVIELKDGDFKSEYAGKMNFYLSAVDDKVKHETDNPTIGLILCKSKVVRQ